MLMKGKVCVVTGAASPHGIGRATANMLAAHGAHVAVIDVSENVSDAAREIALTILALHNAGMVDEETLRDAVCFPRPESRSA